MMSLEFLLIFIARIPPWVFPLFIILLVLGLQARRERLIPIRLYWFLPLIGLIGLPGLIAIGRSEGLAVFAVAYVLGALFGKRFQRQVFLGFDGTKAHVKGEWLTLTVMMLLFFANFVKGAADGLAPDFAQSLVFVLLYVGLTAFSSGTFLGRSLHMIKLSRTNQLYDT